MSNLISDSYYALLAKIESGNNPNAKNPNSTASGLYQFLQGTWENLGFNWSDRWDVNTQNAAAQKLTEQNASVLERGGVAISDASLYAAHFLGAGTATKVFQAGGDQSMSSVVGNWNSVASANGFASNMTVSSFGDWLQRKGFRGSG